jgi:hypothetical protein
MQALRYHSPSASAPGWRKFSANFVEIKEQVKELDLICYFAVAKYR